MTINTAISGSNDTTGWTLPSERTFRDAWKAPASGVIVEIDIPKAKDIVRNNLRVAREPLLGAQDILWFKAQEAGQSITAIVAEKNRLRNAPAHASITNATTAAQLSAITIDTV